MRLPVMPPVSPMLAKAASRLPTAPSGSADWWYEPKWDGFRCIVFRDRDEVELGSRNERPLTRYFPDVVDAVRAELPQRCVLDGEVVIGGPRGLDFTALLNRIHPAESRVCRLATETPASFVAFDLLALDDADVRPRPFLERRRLLEQAMGRARAPVHLTPTTADVVLAEDWFVRFEGAGLDGVVAKPAGLAYREGERAMVKVKHQRSAEVVVAGFRWHRTGGVVGSLLLGLYGADQRLHHVGVAASFTARRRAELVDELSPYVAVEPSTHPWGEWAETEAHATQRLPGATTRWNAGKDLSFALLRPELVAEVAYDHLQGDRFRHPVALLRWRSDREPTSCTYDQLEVAAPAELASVFGA